jgi:catechol 2,3-dioxygenase-like lactoylglutathione lyase family enzyme
MKPIERIVETAIYADDLAAAERFYREILGLALLAKESGRHVFFEAGESQVLLVFRAGTTEKGDHLPAHGARGAGHVAFGIAAEELDPWRDRLTKHNVEIEREENWPRGGRSLYFRDPAGNLVELVTPGVWGLPSGW